MIGTGSREESDQEAGSAHFLEHFVFKGTKKFPKMYDINEAVEKVGGAFNAYTGQHEMGFWVKMDKDNLPLATRIVAQVVTEPILPEEHFDKERGIILEELHMSEDMPSSKAAEECEKLIFGKTNLGRPIIGTIKSLKEITVGELRTYFDKWFAAENMVVGVVGAYGKDEDVLEMIRKEFAPLVEDTKQLPAKNKFVWDEQTEPKTILTNRKVEQAAVVMAFRGIDINDKRRWALKLTNLILGDGWLSRLMKEIREERGWAYGIGSDIEMFTDAGCVLIGAGLPKDKLNEAVELITEISLGLAVHGKWQITKEELETAKNTYKGRLALSFDRPERVLGSALVDITFREKIYSPEEMIENIEKVSLEEVQAIAGEIFRRENLSVSVVGDYKKLDFKI